PAPAAAWANQAIRATSQAGLYLQGSIDPGLARAVATRPGVAAVMGVDDPLAQVAGAPARIAGIDPGPAARMADFGVRSGRLGTLHGSRLFVSAAQAAQHGWQAGSAGPRRLPPRPPPPPPLP